MPIDLALRAHFVTRVECHIRVRSRLVSLEPHGALCKAQTFRSPPSAPPSTQDLLFLHVCMHASGHFRFRFFVFFYSSQNCDNKVLHSLKDSSGCNRPHSLCSVSSLPLAVHDLSPVDLCRWNLIPKTRTRPKLSSPYNHQIAPIPESFLL